MIDNLRRERLVFDTIYRKFERELAEQKKQMAEVIEMSNSAYEARDEAQAKVISLKEKSEKENQAYNQEIKELDRILAQDKKLKAFMAAKTFDRLDSMSTEDGQPSHHDLQKNFTGEIKVIFLSFEP
jgi:3-methyladenine DNA glycosylase/8-oxoguanine DNA glycosylase